MCQALLKIKATKHPISEETIGFRIQAAVPNNAGRGFHGNAIPSFAKKYLIGESSDYTTLGDKQIAAFVDDLNFQKYNEFVMVSDARAT
jgi:hypothetical protein